ncbi:MAG: hypothetical protein LBE32_05730 [Burkholderiales bacterium]|jgi:hypothetical protein|nr:hypothetical protein [Burkholderiales bacterium]
MKRIINVSAFFHRQADKQFQQGLVLEIMLVVLVAIFLAAIGLYRSVDTSTGVSGNLAFKRDAENRAQVALNEALTWIENENNFRTYIIGGADFPGGNFSQRMLQTDGKGIPVILGNIGLFDSTYTTPPTAQMNDMSSGMRVRYLIERMCTQDGPVSDAFCSVTDGSGTIKTRGTQPGETIGGRALRPLLRVSIRVDGPRDTVAYIQAMIDP